MEEIRYGGNSRKRTNDIARRTVETCDQRFVGTIGIQDTTALGICRTADLGCGFPNHLREVIIRLGFEGKGTCMA